MYLSLHCQCRCKYHLIKDVWPYLSLSSADDDKAMVRSQFLMFGRKINFQLGPLRFLPNHFKIAVPSLIIAASVRRMASPLGNKRSI